MATLTAEELLDIRAVVGDGCDKYADAQIQAWYDAVDGSLPLTYVAILQRMWAAAKASTLTLHTGLQVLSTANIKAIKDRLDYWEGKAGVSGGIITPGVIGLGIDYTAADLEAGL